MLRNADPHHFNAEPDPAFHFNADPDPAFHINPDPDPYLSEANLRPLTFQDSILSLRASMLASVALHGSIFSLYSSCISKNNVDPRIYLDIFVIDLQDANKKLIFSTFSAY